MCPSFSINGQSSLSHDNNTHASEKTDRFYRIFANRIVYDRAVLLLSRANKRHTCIQGSVAKILQNPVPIY